MKPRTTDGHYPPLCQSRATAPTGRHANIGKTVRLPDSVGVVSFRYHRFVQANKITPQSIWFFAAGPPDPNLRERLV
jgi:hypothetical protein